MTKVGDNILAENANWKFSGDTVQTFDSHVKRSVPLYEEGHSLICHLSDFFIKHDSVVYEIGTSTGELMLKMVRHNRHKSGARFIGIDLEQDMIDLANKKKAQNDITNVDFIQDDILQYNFEPSDFIVAYYTIQFIRPSERQRMIDKIYQSLKWGGALLMFEKVRACDARFQDIMSSLYNEYKLEQGYSSEEIVAKARSLKGILEPFSTQGNQDLLKRAGFVDSMTVMKYVAFEGFLAIK